MLNVIWCVTKQDVAMPITKPKCRYTFFGKNKKYIRNIWENQPIKVTAETSQSHLSILKRQARGA
jgi:hypothetical protein